MNTYVEALLAVGGAAGALTAVIVLIARIMPVLKMGGRVGSNEKRIKELEERQTAFKNTLRDMREESRTADRLLVRAMVEIVDNRITNNNIEGLKSTKKDLMAFLQAN